MRRPRNAGKQAAERRREHHAEHRHALSIRATLTVNSPLRLMNSLVPSSGSTSQKEAPSAGCRPASVDSSDTMKISGVSALRRADDQVIGLPVGQRDRRIVRFISNFEVGGVNSITQCPASRTMSSSAACSSLSSERDFMGRSGRSVWGYKTACIKLVIK
jgi:hypothetical protein